MILKQGHLQDDFHLGQPDWPEVIAETNLDLSQLLPSQRELSQLVDKLSDDKHYDDASALWAEVEEKCQQEFEQGKPMIGHEHPNGSHGKPALHAPSTIRFETEPHEAGTHANGNGKTSEEHDVSRKEGGARLAAQVHEGAQGRTGRKKQKQEDKRQQLYRAVKSADVLLRVYQVRCTGCSVFDNIARTHACEASSIRCRLRCVSKLRQQCLMYASYSGEAWSRSHAAMHSARYARALPARHVRYLC